MAITYKKKTTRKNNILYTIITAILLCTVFLTMANYFYKNAENEAYETLHMQTNQIKDYLILQIKSDRENLVTMSHFAAKLYADGESYDRMFDSFEPIGLLSNIGILNPDNTFVTKKGMVDLNGRISFSEEAAKDGYISGRIADLTTSGKEIIRIAVPIKHNSQVIGILYGAIHLDIIGEKYNKMAKELDAQLFVYDVHDGNYIINTIEGAKGNISSLESREYNDGHTYEELVSNQHGFSSFKSILNGRDLYSHCSTIDDFGWRIMLARYSSQVFNKAHGIAAFTITLFAIMLLIIILYVAFVIKKERRISATTKKASEIRKLLLEVNQHKENIQLSLQKIMETASSRSAIYVDIDGESCYFAHPDFADTILIGEDRKYFVGELFRYAVEFREGSGASVGIINLNPDKELSNANPVLYQFLKEHNIECVSFAAITHNNNTSVLGAINPKNKLFAKNLLEEIAVCFSIAICNKNHLKRTYIEATIDHLTGLLNRVVYKKDLIKLNEEKPEKFSCIYIDANELHIINNKLGHEAGDEMLVYIANSLKNIFFGQRIYRMGGDEFLVFAKNTEPDIIKRSLEVLNSQLASADYHVAVGVSYRTCNTDTEEMVREAEIRMYEAKAQYYQNKEQTNIQKYNEIGYIRAKTGIREIDVMLSVLNEHYYGIYRVSLDTDRVHCILMPAYLRYNKDEENFSGLLTAYINKLVHPDFHRAVLSFLNYDAIKQQFSEGKVPKIRFKKLNGESVILSVYPLDKEDITSEDTLWVLAKD